MDAATDTRADDLAQLAAMELLDVGWSTENIAAALNRSKDWVEATFDNAAMSAAGPIH